MKRLLARTGMILVMVFYGAMVWAGLPGDTPILTRDGFVPIEKVKAGTLILGYDPEEHNILYVPVKAVSKHQTEWKVTIQTTQGSISSSEDHPFYDWGIGEDKPAEEFKPGDILMAGYRSAATCLSSPLIEPCVAVTYEIELDENEKVHHYCATEQCILTHNTVYVSAATRALQWIVAHKDLILKGIETAGHVVAAAQASKSLKDDYIHKCEEKVQPTADPSQEGVSDKQGSAGGALVKQADQAKEKEAATNDLKPDNKSKEKLVYERNPAHLIGRRTADKSAAFDNDAEGQRYLDKSVPADPDGNSSRRIAVVDKKTYAIFNQTRYYQTADGTLVRIYHGHKAKWDGLNETERGQFKKARLTNNKGRPFAG